MKIVAAAVAGVALVLVPVAARAQVCIPGPCESTATTGTTRPPVTTAPPATAPESTTRTTAKSTTTRGPTTTKPPATLPPVVPQPTVTTFSDLPDAGPSGVIAPVFPVLSGVGFLGALGILVGAYIRHRRGY